MTAVYRSDVDTFIGFDFVSFFIGGLFLCSKWNEGCDALRMVTGDFDIHEVFAIFHGLDRMDIELSEVIQNLPRICVTDHQVATMCIDELAFNGIQRAGILGIAVADIIVVICDCDIPQFETLLFFNGLIVHGQEILQQTFEGPLIGEGRLLTIL